MGSRFEAAFFGVIVAVFFVMIFIALLIAGLVCLFVYAKKDSRGEKPGAALSVAAAVLIGIGGIGTYFVAAIMFGIIVGMSESTASVDLGEAVIIDEIGESYEYFIAEGTRYDVLDMYPDFDVCSELGVEKYLEYYSDDEYYWYYSVENAGGFELLYDGCDLMYAPADEHEAIYAYYSEAHDGVWYSYSDNIFVDRVELTDEASAALTSLANTADSMSVTKIKSEGFKYVGVFLPSADGIFYVAELPLLRHDGKLYLFIEYGEDDYEYYVAEVPSLIAARLDELK